MEFHQKKFPHESDDYRNKRNEVLALEIELREKVATLGKMRAQLPLGGALKEDYIFNSPSGEIKLSELFKDGKKSLIIYSFMYGPAMEKACPACTSLIDGFNGMAQHVRDRANFVVIAKSDIDRLMNFAKEREWNNIDLLSSSNNSYNQDYFAETESGSQIPALNVFTKTDEGIFHFYNTELLYADLEGHPRHVDSIWPLWNFFDMIPEGRGDWGPKLKY